jgi:hypothetical protein
LGNRQFFQSNSPRRPNGKKNGSRPNLSFWFWHY